MSAKLIVECARCGEQQTVERAGRFRDEDYYELWHEHADAEADIRRLQLELEEAHADIERLRCLIGQLEVPSLEQIELRALRGQLDVLLPATYQDEPEESPA